MKQYKIRPNKTLITVSSGHVYLVKQDIDEIIKQMDDGYRYYPFVCVSEGFDDQVQTGPEYDLFINMNSIVCLKSTTPHNP
jgi:hypothetical protein